jgi:hypothetical protein
VIDFFVTLRFVYSKHLLFCTNQQSHFILRKPTFLICPAPAQALCHYSFTSRESQTMSVRPGEAPEVLLDDTAGLVEPRLLKAQQLQQELLQRLLDGQLRIEGQLQAMQQGQPQRQRQRSSVRYGILFVLAALWSLALVALGNCPWEVPHEVMVTAEFLDAWAKYQVALDAYLY